MLSCRTFSILHPQVKLCVILSSAPLTRNESDFNSEKELIIRVAGSPPGRRSSWQRGVKVLGEDLLELLVDTRDGGQSHIQNASPESTSTTSCDHLLGCSAAGRMDDESHGDFRRTLNKRIETHMQIVSECTSLPSPPPRRRCQTSGVSFFSGATHLILH